jgi:DNA primase
MGRSRDDEWEDDYEIYTANQVEGVLEFCEVEVVSDTNTHFLAYCPFHGNTDSPALAVDKAKGLFNCFNPACQEAGTLLDLVRRRTKQNPFQAQRTIIKYANEHSTPFADRLAEAMAKPPEFVEFPQDVLTKMKTDFVGSAGEQYMKSRGFTDDTLDYFDVGYSAKQNMVIVPMHDPKGMPIGLIGRIASHEEKRFKNSLNLPKSKTAWNIHRAKTQGETVVICEASYDAMRIHQAGYPNVVALLGGHVTSYHLTQLGRYFSKIIIMTDFDHKIYRPNCRMCRGRVITTEVGCNGHRPGRDLGRQIVKGLPDKKVMWGAFDDECVFPHGAKDAGDMTDDEIRQCLKNAVSNLEYSLWKIEDMAA